MNENVRVRVLLRHTSGSKANAVQEFSTEGRNEIKLGRDPACDVVFDAVRDDVVSRVHAVIRADAEARSGFSIEDLNSRNGLYLNRQKIDGKAELLPEDLIVLGVNGPSFIFDLSPRPGGLLARTRVVDVSPAATRLVDAAKAADPAVTSFETKAFASADPFAATQKSAPVPPKETIGRNTMLHELGKVRTAADTERKKTVQKGVAALAAVVALAVAGGGFLTWRQSQERKTQEESIRSTKAELERVRFESDVQQREGAESLNKRLGTSALDITRQFGAATARLEARWRLYDKDTGKEIFIKTIKQDGRSYRMFWRRSDGKVLPVLTLDDENHKNIPVGEDSLGGSAFGVSEQGFLLTNKHLAAAWRMPAGKDVMFGEDDSIHFTDCQSRDRRRRCEQRIVAITDSVLRGVVDWVPESGSPLYSAKDLRYIGGHDPDNASTKQGNFFGKNDSLQVTFAEQRLAMSATLARVSDENDVALIKVDTPSKIAVVRLSNDAPPSTGEKVVVLGYPAISLHTFAVTQKFVDNKQFKTNSTEVPRPYVTEGIVASVSADRTLTPQGVTMVAPSGDMMQLTINATGAGNSGGPVFNALGEVIGIFNTTYWWGHASSTGAVPIKHGVELMR